MTSVRIERVGHSVSTAGDANGDGYSDVVVGAPYGYRGAAYIFLGSSSGIATQDASSADTIITGSNSVGYSVSSAGDFNDDGFDDVLVADPAYYSNEPDLEGNVY